MCRKSSKDGDPRLPDRALAIKGLQAMPAPSLPSGGVSCLFSGFSAGGNGKSGIWDWPTQTGTNWDSQVPALSSGSSLSFAQ